MSTLGPVSEDGLWPYLATLLPEDLEETARASGALVRCRNVPSAEALLRLVLAYAVSDLSMKDVAAWAKVTHVATISGPGLFYRMRGAEQWLEQVLAQTVESEAGLSPVCLPLRIVDATVITGPGSTGTDWRIHARIDPDTGRFRSVECAFRRNRARVPKQSDRAFRLKAITSRGRSEATARAVHVVSGCSVCPSPANPS